MKKILFLIGSRNQTIQMHRICSYLMTDYDCYFSQIFASHPVITTSVKLGILNHTALAGKCKKDADEYLSKHLLRNDYRCEVYHNKYDLVIACTDLIVPKKLQGIKIIWVQEGMIDEFTMIAKITKYFKLPRYLAIGTSLNGSSNICDIYCAASKGYKNYLTWMGTNSAKIIVTGIPNFDNVKQFTVNTFPYKDYVLVATSDIRECFRFDNRIRFIKNAVKVADGRQLIFKLHPNEKIERATREIEMHTPSSTLIFTSGNTDHLVANCLELITQYSTIVYTGILLGKKVHSYFDLDFLKKLIPIQNEGTSAKKIAEISRGFIEYRGTGTAFLSKFYTENSQTILADAI